MSAGRMTARARFQRACRREVHKQSVMRGQRTSLTVYIRPHPIESSLVNEVCAMESRVSRLAVIAALALLRLGPATACPDSSSFFAHRPQELTSFSSDVEDESVSSYIREHSAASIPPDVDAAIARWELALAIECLGAVAQPRCSDRACRAVRRNAPFQ